MQLKTIFNHVVDYKPFVVDKVELIGEMPNRIEITMRRMACPQCGIKVERVPWSDGKSPLTTELKWFLAGWARRMSWKEVSACFHVSWDHVYNSLKHAV